MNEPTLPHDPLWPRAGRWLAAAGTTHGTRAEKADLAIVGVPAHLTSITPTGAHATPGAIRDALSRYSTFAGSRGIDLARLSAVDLGDVAHPDGAAGEARVRAKVASLLAFTSWSSRLAATTRSPSPRCRRSSATLSAMRPRHHRRPPRPAGRHHERLTRAPTRRGGIAGAQHRPDRHRRLLELGSVCRAGLRVRHHRHLPR